MASNLPIPAPPRTPTPPTPIPTDGDAPWNANPLGLYGTPRSSTPDVNLLSPRSDHFGSMAQSLPSPADPSKSFSSMNSDGSMGAAQSPRNPFNFQTQTYTAPSPVVKSVRTPFHGAEQAANPLQNIGQRRGHRYKHSSVSTQHQIFLEPPPRAPLALPASLPIPTLNEAWKSMSIEQTRRGTWSIGHMIVAAYVLYSAEGSLALTALSHLIFFDAISAMICVAVDVFCNFEVWKRSSIKHPFG